MRCGIVAWVGGAWGALVVAAAAGGEAQEDAVARARLGELRREIARHDELYFRRAAPEIGDAEYDRLKAELRALAAAYPDDGDAKDGEAGPEMGDDRAGEWPTVAHRAPMGSLDKVVDAAGLAAFHERVARGLGREQVDYVLEPKFDGLAISVVYEHGRLRSAVTRGDGKEGDDVTPNVRALAGLPEQLAADGLVVPTLIELRGEVYVRGATLARVNAEQETAGEPTFAHPRTLAAGTLKQRDAGLVRERGLEIVFFGWGAVEPADVEPSDLTAFRARLEGWGLPVAPVTEQVRGAAALVATVQAWETRRREWAFPSDGLVVKVAGTAEQRVLGWGAGAPRWAVAYKFASDRATTRLRAITLQVGRTGAVTPVAELEPVRLGGTRVARATLHHFEQIVRQDLRVGDWVEVEKAGEIIPAIVGVDRTRRAAGARAFVAPSECPGCETVLERVGEAGWRCVNAAGCPPQIVRRIAHFASRGAMDIRGLGPATVEALVNAGLVREPADLYGLEVPALQTVPGIGARRAEALHAAIAGSREQEWARVITGLGWRGIGPAAARVVAVRWPDAAALLEAGTGAGASDEEDAVGRAVRAALAEPGQRDGLRALARVGLGGSGGGGE